MTKNIVAMIFLISSVNLFAQVKPDSLISNEQQPVKFEGVVEEPPFFPGGTEALRKFIKDNTMVPFIVKEKKLKGKTVLKLGIYSDGTAVVLTTLKKMENCSECDQAAIEMIKKMPKWTPAKKNAEYVAAFFNLPVEFTYKK